MFIVLALILGFIMIAGGISITTYIAVLALFLLVRFVWPYLAVLGIAAMYRR